MNEVEINRRIDAAVKPLVERISALEAPSALPTTLASSPNYLPNSHPEWSTLAYGTGGTSASTVSDANRNAYNWAYQTAATTDLSGASALLANGHSGFAGLNVDAPIWDRTNGTFCIGGDTTLYDISCPLTTDFVFPGQKFYVYVEASLASTSVDVGTDQQFYCGFWDNTAGQRKWIEGTFAPTAAMYGVGGARTLKYKIHAKTDSGTEMLSSEITVNNCPATLSENGHVRVAFPGAPGFIYYGIYRRDGSTYRKVGEVKNSTSLSFYDMQENSGSPEPGYPSVTGTTPQAYAIMQPFEPTSLSSTSFASYVLTIQVPITYDRSLTANASQYFRFGVDALVGSSASRRGIVLRRIALSEGFGAWTRCPKDLTAASGPSTSAAGAPAPGGPPAGDPPFGGGGRSGGGGENNLN